MKAILSILLFISFNSFGQVIAPVINASQIFTDSVTISWSNPANVDSFVLQRDTLSDFSTASQVYAGSQQIYYDTTNNPNTDYYYRVKAVNASNVSSAWVGKYVKTFWSPSATSEGGNRVAVQADVDNTELNPDGFIEVGDYLYVGYNGSGGYSVVGVPYQWGRTIYLQKPPTLAAGKKICIIGGRGYDYIELNLENNKRSGTDTLIITNIGGQVRAGQFRLTNAQNVKVTGKYDPVAKTGSSKYLGFDSPDWSNLYGSFGFYFQSTWGQRSGSIIILSGDCVNVNYEYIQAGEGGFASIAAKNDSYHPSDRTVTATADLNTYATNTQSVSLPTNPAWTPERIRITLNTVTSVNIDYIEFVGTGSTTGTYTYEAENFDGSNHAVNAGGHGGTVTGLTTSSTSDKAYIDIPVKDSLVGGGTYDVSIVMANTVSTSISTQIASTPTDGLHISHCYFADGGSEGIYFESTQAAPTQAGKNVSIENCVYVRNGGNSIQIGQLKDSARFQNNTFILGGFEWNDEFQKFQDQQLQFSVRQNKFDFTDNLVLGVNSFWNYAVNTLAYDTTSATDTSNILNNAFLNSKDYALGFANVGALGKGVMNWNGNYWGRFGTLNYYNKLFTVTVRNYVVKISNTGGGVVTANVNDNYYDTTTQSGGTFAINGGDASVTLNQSNNTRIDHVPYPIFNNFMDFDSTFDFSAMEQWTDVLEPQWNSTNRSGTKFDSAATAQGVTIDQAVIERVYNLGDIVRHNGKFYESLIADNSGHEPTGYTDSYWKLIVFSNGSVMPIDDVRQRSGSFYLSQGMGSSKIAERRKKGIF